MPGRCVFTIQFLAISFVLTGTYGAVNWLTDVLIHQEYPQGHAGQVLIGALGAGLLVRDSWARKITIGYLWVCGVATAGFGILQLVRRTDIPLHSHGYQLDLAFPWYLSVLLAFAAGAFSYWLQRMLRHPAVRAEFANPMKWPTPQLYAVTCLGLAASTCLVLQKEAQSHLMQQLDRSHASIVTTDISSGEVLKPAISLPGSAAHPHHPTTLGYAKDAWDLSWYSTQNLHITLSLSGYKDLIIELEKSPETKTYSVRMQPLSE